jgi:methyl-accepting chemotaxis protein
MNLNVMKISARLGLAFGAVLSLLLVVCVSSIWGLAQLDQAMADVVTDKVPKTLTSGDWENSVLKSARHMRNVLILDSPGDIAAELAALAELKKQRAQYLSELQKTVTSSSGMTALQRIADARAAYIVPEDAFMQAAAAADYATAKKILLDDARPKQQAYLQAIADFTKTQRNLIDASNQAANVLYAQVRTTVLLVSLVSLALGVALAYAITRSIVKPLGLAAELVRHVADGDLAMPIKVEGRDEVATLLQALHGMQANLVKVVANVRRSSDSVALASTEIAQGNQDLSERTENQAGALEQTSASMEEMGAAVKHNAASAQQANQLALTASEMAERGGKVVAQVESTMRGIDASSKRIADIISVIDGIAFQTNILALNAAVEAARAGESGRGFAVVATEVRSLAGRSAEAARQIKELISDSVARVGDGSALVEQASLTMREMQDSIGQVTAVMQAISASSAQQSDGVSQVVEAVAHMDQATQQNAAMVEQMAATALSLQDKARELVQVVSVFKLGDGHGLGNIPMATLAPAPAPRARPVLAPTPPRRALPSAARRPQANAPRLAPAKASVAPAAAAPAARQDDEWETF